MPQSPYSANELTQTMSEEDIKLPSFIFPDTLVPKPEPTELLSRTIQDLFSLKGKYCVVTGAARSRGIGFAAAEAYAQVGAAGIALWDYNDCSESAKYLNEKYGTKVLVYKVDVSKEADVKAAMLAVEKEFGTIDVFVANAGVIWDKGTILNDEVDDDKDWHRLIDVDLNGVYYCAKNVGKIFKKHHTGSLVITASMSGLIVNVPNFQAAYNVAKAGCIHLSKSLSVEFAGIGARVNCVCPGYMDTGLSDCLPKKVLASWCTMIPMGRQGLAKELAGAYLYLASDASTYTTGAALVVDGGFTIP